MAMNGRRAILLDKDGTLVENVPYNVDPAQMRLLPAAASGLRRLQAAGYLLAVVSNQSGVALGYFAEAALVAVEERLQALLLAEGVTLARFLYCPHHPQGRVPAYSRPCPCRKPAPGLLQQTAAELALDLPASWMVGDILNDVEAGRRAGCRTVLIDNGGETEWVAGPLRTPLLTARDLMDAAEQIIACDSAAAQAVSARGLA